jgi:uncharacterized protein (UPF0332 family)
MEFDWCNYLLLAEEIANRNEEQCLRSSISRAYYAAFHVSLKTLQQNGKVRLEDQGRGIHQELIKTLRSSRNSVEKKTGNRLDRLRCYRNNADYKPIMGNLPDRAKESVRLARIIIEEYGGKRLPAYRGDIQIFEESAFTGTPPQ